jgi:hypothetical protein
LLHQKQEEEAWNIDDDNRRAFDGANVVRLQISAAWSRALGCQHVNVVNPQASPKGNGNGFATSRQLDFLHCPNAEYCAEFSSEIYPLH